MGRRHEKVQEKLAARQAAHAPYEGKPGYKKPGSQNSHKQGGFIPFGSTRRK